MKLRPSVESITPWRHAGLFLPFSPWCMYACWNGRGQQSMQRGQQSLQQPQPLLHRQQLQPQHYQQR